MIQSGAQNVTIVAAKATLRESVVKDVEDLAHRVIETVVVAARDLLVSVTVVQETRIRVTLDVMILMTATSEGDEAAVIVLLAVRMIGVIAIVTETGTTAAIDVETETMILTLVTAAQ